MRAPQPPRPPHTPIRHLPTALHPPTPLACLAAILPPFAVVFAGAQFSPSTSARVEGGVPMRRGGGAAAHVGRGGRLGAQGVAGGLAVGGGAAPPLRSRRAKKV